MFNLIFLIFIVILLFSAVTIFTTMRRVGKFQNRIFDQVERELDRAEQDQQEESSNRPRNYECNQCGAALGDNSDISPSGDFKCTYCGKWSNIHS